MDHAFGELCKSLCNRVVLFVLSAEDNFIYSQMLLKEE